MRILLALALGAILSACSEPAKPEHAGPAPLPPHPVGDVSKPVALPPPSGPGPSASAAQCGGQSAQTACN